MAKEKRNLTEDVFFLRVGWNPGSIYPLKAQEAWLEAAERAIDAEAEVERLTHALQRIESLYGWGNVETAAEKMHAEATKALRLVHDTSQNGK